MRLTSDLGLQEIVTQTQQITLTLVLDQPSKSIMSKAIIGVTATLAVMGAGYALVKSGGSKGGKKKTVGQRITGAASVVKRELTNPSPNTVFGRNLALFAGAVYLIKFHGSSLTMSQ